MAKPSMVATFKDVTIDIVYTEKAAGRDGKGRWWESKAAWFFACRVCGNCGKHCDSARDALAQAESHAVYDHRAYEGREDGTVPED